MLTKPKKLSTELELRDCTFAAVHRRARLAVAALLSCVLIGCGKTDEPTAKREVTEYRCSLLGAFDHGDETPLVYYLRGKELTRSPLPREPVIIPTADLDGNPIDAPGVLTAKILIPEGWTEVLVEVEPGYFDKRGWREVTIQPKAGWTDRLKLLCFVDNLDGPAGHIEFGQVRLPLEANGRDRVTVHAPTRAEGAVVKVNGRELTTLPLAEEILRNSVNEYAKRYGYGNRVVCVLDVSGRRKYSSRIVSYGSGIGPSPPAPTFYEGKHFHVIGAYPPQTAIDWLTGVGVSEVPTRLQIRDETGK